MSGQHCENYDVKRETVHCYPRNVDRSCTWSERAVEGGLMLSHISMWSSGSSRSSQSFPKISRRSGRLRRLLVSICSSRSLQILKTRGRQRCSWIRQQSFGAIFGNEIADINRRASLLACYLLAPSKSSKNPTKTQGLASTDISEARRIRSLPYSGTRAQTAWRGVFLQVGFSNYVACAVYKETDQCEA